MYMYVYNVESQLVWGWMYHDYHLIYYLFCCRCGSSDVTRREEESCKLIISSQCPSLVFTCQFFFVCTLLHFCGFMCM